MSYFVFGLLLLSVPLFGAPTLSADINVAGRAIDEGHRRAYLVGPEVDLKSQLPISESVEGRVSVLARIRTGTSQALYDNEFRVGEDFRIKEARLAWTPLKSSLTLGADLGVLNQAGTSHALFLSEKSFPGIQEHVEYRVGDFSVKASAAQSVAIAPSTENDLGITNAPLLLWESLEVGYRTDDFRANITVTHFNYRDLPVSVAAQGAFYGNSIQGSTPETASFLYGFDGVNVSVGVGGRVGPFEPSVRVTGVRNTTAPAGRRDGYLFSVSAKTRLSSNLTVTPEFSIFELESDVAPAYYTNQAWGHTNRRGFGGRLLANWTDPKVQVGLEYVQSDPREVRQVQQRLHFLSLVLGVSYELL